MPDIIPNDDRIEYMSEILKIIEAGLEGNKEKLKDFALLLKSKIKDKRLAKALQNIIDGKKGSLVYAKENKGEKLSDKEQNLGTFIIYENFIDELKEKRRMYTSKEGLKLGWVIQWKDMKELLEKCYKGEKCQLT